jgi:DNA-binding MarR family transcriptional regulator
MADIVRRLVKRGWLKRRRTPQDARTYAISLTVEGQRILDKVLPIAMTVDAALLSDLAVEEQQNFTSLLQTILGHHGPLSLSRTKTLHLCQSIEHRPHSLRS